MSNSQVPFATLGAPIGYVSKLSSSVVVQSIDGQDRLIKIGDPIFFGETVVTGNNGSVTITFLDKTEIVIGPYSIVEISDEIDDLEKLNQSSIASIEPLQEAILSGADPTTIQQAPAAGDDSIEGSHRVGVSISRNNSNEAALPDFGYDTDNSFLGSNSVTELKTGIFEGAKADRTIGISATVSDNAESDTKIGVPRIVFESAGSDGIYNAAEIGTDGTVTATITVAGSEAGDTLIYTVGGGAAVTVILTDELIATGIIIEVSPDDSVVATLSDAVGNTSETEGSVVVKVDTLALAGTVTVDNITADDVINATESGQTIAVSGTATGGDIAEGDTVTLEINSTTYTTTVATGGVWSINVAGSDLAADTTFDAVVGSSDAAGNAVESIGSSTHTVDVKAFGQIDVDRIAGDSIVDADESATGKLVEITGYVGNDAMPGDVIAVILDGVVIGTGTVSTDQNSAGKYLYSVNVLGSDLANTSASSPHLKVTVTGEDVAGNAFSSENTEVYFVDTSVDVEVDVFVEDTNYDGTIGADEEESLLVGGWLESGGSVSSITITDSDGTILTITDNFVLDDDGSWLYFENSVDVSSLTDGELSVVVNVVDNSGNSGSSDAQTLTKDSDDNEGVTYLSDTVSVDTRITAINFIQGASDGTESDDDLRGVGGASSDSIDGFGGDDVLIGGGGADTLTGGAGDDILIGGMLSGDDNEIDTLTGGIGEDIFILQGDDSLDVITDFNAQDDRLDLTALLTDLADNPGVGAAKSAIEAFLSENVKVLDQSVEINGATVATFGSDSDFDSDGSGAVNSTDLIRIIFNDQEYSINIDG
jgi:Ca2+-binding RTX toxin-like protein